MDQTTSYSVKNQRKKEGFNVRWVLNTAMEQTQNHLKISPWETAIPINISPNTVSISAFRSFLISFRFQQEFSIIFRLQHVLTLISFWERLKTLFEYRPVVLISFTVREKQEVIWVFFPPSTSLNSLFVFKFAEKNAIFLFTQKYLLKWKACKCSLFLCFFCYRIIIDIIANISNMEKCNNYLTLIYHCLKQVCVKICYEVCIFK